MKRKILPLIFLFLVLSVSLGGCYDNGYVLREEITGELVATPAQWAELDFFSRNGSVTVKPVEGSDFKVEMEMRVRTVTRSEAERVAEENVVVENQTGLLRIGVDDSRISARIVAEVPRDLYYDLTVRTSNGSITLEELELGEVRLQASNGSLNLTNINFDYLNGVTSNGSLRTSGIFGDRLQLETSNGSVNLEGAARVFELRTSNSRMVLEPEFLSDRPEMLARTSNGNISLTLPRDRNTGFEIRAQTSNGTFNHSNLSRVINLRDGLIQTQDFSNMPVQVKIDLSTSNGNIEVKER